MVRRLPPWLRSAALLTWALGLVGLVSMVAVHAFAPLLFWDVKVRDRPGQLTIFNVAPGGGFYGLPVEMGDYDGDGLVDLAIAPMGADSGPAGDRAKAGEIYVYKGDGVIGGTIDRAAMAERRAGLTIWGARADDFAGTELFSADVDGDGLTDLIAGSQNYDGPDGVRDNSGGVFVVLGRAGLLADGATIDLADPPAGVVVIAGRRAGDRLGVWVEAGDLDGDGLADLLLGADQASGPDPAAPRPHAGLLAVVYGRRDLPRVLDLAETEKGGLEGVAIIHGPDSEDHFGSSLHARDLDRDGLPELIAASAVNRLSASYPGTGSQFPAHAGGAGDGPGNVRPDCGEAFVIFSDPGGARRLPPLVDLAAPAAELQGRITMLYGKKKFEYCGEEIATGDFNGDGFPDLALGALAATSPEGQLQAGAVRIVYWREGLRGTVIDFQYPESYPPDVAVSFILGFDYLEILGDTLAAGDFNHDGIDDLAVGIPHTPPGGDPRAYAGRVAVVFGRSEPFPPEVFPDLPDLPVTISFVLGSTSADFLSYSMEARDYDRDGYTDLFPNAMRGDGSAEIFDLDAGEAYLISGFHLSGARVQVDSVEPGIGRLGEEVPVLVAGSGFTRDEDTRVHAGGAPASEVKVLSGSQISCRLPPRGEPAVVEVTVENRHGASTLAEGFRYVAPTDFVRGDASGDLRLGIEDAVSILSYLFLGAQASCLDRLDANDDGGLDISDAIYALLYLFSGGLAPPPPFPLPGPDPTAGDPLGCSP